MLVERYKSPLNLFVSVSACLSCFNHLKLVNLFVGKGEVGIQVLC